jgi:hypothetical protein
MRFLVGIGVLLLLIIALFIVDITTGTKIPVQVTVLEKVFSPSSTSIGYDTEGDMQVISTPERYTILALTPDGIRSIQVYRSQYVNAQVDSVLTVWIVEGGISNSRYY